MDTQVTATVTFPNWDEDAPTMREEIVTRAAELLIEQDDSYLKDAIAALAKAKIEERVTLAVREVFESGVQKTDWRGNPVGKSFSVDEMIQRSAHEWLEVQVDARNGKLPDGYCRNQVTRFEYLVRELYKAKFDKEFSGRVETAVMQIKDQINAKIEADIKAYLRSVIAA